jgi:hypothetical protein
MKPLIYCCTDVLHIDDWRCFDNCPVCRMMIKSVEEGSDFSLIELEAAFTQAEKEGDVLI